MGASGNCACASSRSLSASSAPAFQTGPSTTQNMGVLEMPLLWRMSNHITCTPNEIEIAIRVHVCRQTLKNCAGQLLNTIGYSHLNLLRTGSIYRACSSSTLLLRLGTLQGTLKTPLKPLAQFPPWIDRKCPFGIKLRWKTSQNMSKYNCIFHTLL